MFICKDCKDTFSEPSVKEYADYVGEGWSRGAIYSYDETCPCCGSEDFVEATVCAYCGEVFEANGEDFCCEACEDEYFAREEGKAAV
jgi:hypothetical protein